MKIPHLVREGRFRPIIAAALVEKGFPARLRVNLPLGGGYSGDIEVTIGSATEKDFEASVSLNDWTRFPARIRAAATALRDGGCFGRFRVTHTDGVLTIISA